MTHIANFGIVLTTKSQLSIELNLLFLWKYIIWVNFLIISHFFIALTFVRLLFWLNPFIFEHEIIYRNSFLILYLGMFILR